MWPFKRKTGSEPSVPRDAGSADAIKPFDVSAHRIVLAYLRSLWAGQPADPVFEGQSLAGLGFNTLSLAEVMFAISCDQGVPIDTIADFLACGIPGGGDTNTANLLRRIVILAESFSEEERDLLLQTGVVGDPSEVASISAEIDNVAFVVKYCRAVASLKDSEAFGGRSGRQVDVEADPGWQ